MTKFIVISGKKQVGKDTLTNILLEGYAELRKKVLVTAFAEPLKEICIGLLGLKREWVYGTNEDKNRLTNILWESFGLEIRLKYSNEHRHDIPVPRTGRMSVREVLQVLGTDIFRALRDDVWAQAPFNKQWDCDVVIINDARFPNEIKVTEDRGATIIRLVRNTGLVDNHESETALDGWEFKTVYENNGTLEELRSFAWKTILL